MELTLCILKPHVFKAPHTLKAIKDIILLNNFHIVDSLTTAMTKEQVELFYNEHQGKFFYNRLVTQMRSGPSEINILAREDAIRKWRELLGPTKVFQARFSHPDTIRGMYGLSDTRNAAHGSDSPESAAREISIFFPNFSTTEWLRDHEFGSLVPGRNAGINR
uniref:Nucleoside diphosphate kinase n=1 Tax=Cacopsylla melanoneura TaxID=428564 RepID=A0A8D8XCQ3_9HEMI